MPRSWSSDLQTIFQSYKRRAFVDIYLNDGTLLPLSRGKLTIEGKGDPIVYNNWIKSISDLSSTIDQSIDHISIACQNVSSDLGFDLASNLRLLDYAVAEYGKQYQSLRTPALVETIPQVFRGVLANAEADETNFSCEMIVDYESLGSVIARRGLSPRCWWTYKNGVECTSVSDEPACIKTLTACGKREVLHQFGGWEFFEQPTSSPPGSGGDGDGGIGGGNCFTLDINVWLPHVGDVPFGELPLGKLREPIPLVSFDRITGEIDYADEILEVWEHETVGYYTFECDGTVLKPTPEHLIWQGFNRFLAADQFRLGEPLKTFDGRWKSSPIGRIKWNSDQKVKVRNLRGRKNHTYFANRTAVSNSKNPDLEL
jgi:hypothetical protein